MKDMNVAKLTSDDLPLFLGITGDLFPDAEVPTVDYDEIISYIRVEAIKLKIQVIIQSHPPTGDERRSDFLPAYPT